MLNENHQKALIAIGNGSDVFSYHIASLLRDIEKEESDFVEICESQSDIPGEKRQPYFGAVATPEGQEWAWTTIPIPSR